MDGDQAIDDPMIVIRPKNYRNRLKEYALCMAEDFDRNITIEINVDLSNKIAKIKIIVHSF